MSTQELCLITASAACTCALDNFLKNKWGEMIHRWKNLVQSQPHPHPALPAGVRWAGWGTATHRHPATWVSAKEAPRSASQKPGQAPLEVNEGDSTAGRTLRRTESRGSGSQWHGSNGPNEGAAQCPRTDAWISETNAACAYAEYYSPRKRKGIWHTLRVAEPRGASHKDKHGTTPLLGGA